MQRTKLKQLLGYGLMLVGLAIPLYCFGTIVWQFWTQGNRYESYRTHVTVEEVVLQQERSTDYNTRLATDNQIVDPFLAEDYSVDYAVLDDPDGVYGYLSIPKLGLLEPVYLGADEAHLSQGLAHVEGTHLPTDGEGIRSVIAGHRGWANQVFFRHLDQLEAGDVLYFDNGQEIISYQMRDSEIILPSEWEKLQADSTKNLLTLLTCDPLFVFNKRLLVHFERVGPVQVLDEEEPKQQLSTASLYKVMTTSQTKESALNQRDGFFLLYHIVCVLCFLGMAWIGYKVRRLWLQ